MQIKEIDDWTKLPWSYRWSHITPEEAAAIFKKRHGVAPKIVYTWGDTVAIPQPGVISDKDGTRVVWD